MKKVWLSVFEGELIPADVTGVQKSDDAFALATKTGDWLQRLQLMTSNSKKCKDGSFPVNNYALVDGSNLTDLGKTVDVLVITWRPKAIEMGEEIITIYDPADPEFKRIQVKADIKDSGCMFGIEFLVWVAEQKLFATFFMGGKSSRREAPNVKALMRKAATLKSHLIKGKTFDWQSPCVTVCSTPFDTPDIEALKEEVEKFNNPPKSDIEAASDAETDATGRDR
jgi:hypothetical protein